MNGKGDSPRNCFSKSFKDNYETISWKECEIVCRICKEEKEQKKFNRMNFKTKTGICKKCEKSL